MRTLWVTGASGIVGSRLVKDAVLSGKYDHIEAFTHSPIATTPTDAPNVHWSSLDISDAAAVEHAAAISRPEVIINPAAMTNVDSCEARQAEAKRANADGPRNLAMVSRALGAHLLHVSTDYVFPGDAAHPGPYREDATPQPINYYGQSKLEGEEAIIATAGGDTRYTIIRTALVYGLGTRTNFVTWLVREISAGKRVKIVRDQFNTPTVADDLASTLLWLAEQGRTGMYHVAGPDRLGRHDWALAIVRHFELDESLIDWVTTPELAQPAPRPLESGLDCARLLTEISFGAPRPRGVAQGLAEIDWLGTQST